MCREHLHLHKSYWQIYFLFQRPPTSLKGMFKIPLGIMPPLQPKTVKIILKH